MSTVFVPCPANTWRITYVMQFAGKHATMSHFINYTVNSVHTLEDLLDHYADSFASNWASNILSRHWSFIQTEGEDMSTQDGTKEITQAHSFSSSSSEIGQPPEVALVLTERTGVRGRSFRGRMYMPGVGATHFDDALPGWNSSFLTGLQTDLDAWRSDAQSSVLLSVGTSQWQVASRHHLGVPRSLAVMTNVTSMTINPQPCSQRRRQTQHHGRL